MNAVGAIRKLILDDAATVALLFDSTSVYPVVLPQQKTFPAVTLAITNAKPNDSKTQISGVDNVMVVVKAFATTYDRVQQIDMAVRLVIDGFNGTVTTSDNETHKFHEIRFLAREDSFDEENKLFVRVVNYDARYYWQ